VTACGHGRLYRFARACVRLVSPRYRVVCCGGDGPGDDGVPIVFISRHHNLFGPWMTMLWFPGCFRVWVYHAFLNPHTSYRHYVDYTFTKRFGWNRLLAKIVAWPLSYGVAAVLRSARCIPVYRGSKQIVETFRQTVRALQEGYPVFIYPDIEYQDTSAETGALHKGFLQLEKYVYRAMGRHIGFVPVYVSRRKKRILIGDPVYFRNGENFQNEREVVYEKIRDGLNRLAAQCGELNL